MESRYKSQGGKTGILIYGRTRGCGSRGRGGRDLHCIWQLPSVGGGMVGRDFAFQLRSLHR